MPRDNTIKVYRSTGLTAPPSFSSNQSVGATFGELAFVDGLTSLYIGRADGSVLWIGAQVTGGSVAQGLEYAVPTMKAVKDYVTTTQSGYFIVKGEDGLTHQIDLAGTLTITGGTGIDVLTSPTEDVLIVTGLTATYTSWGVVKVNSGGPIIIDTNGLNIGTDKTLWRLRDEKGVIDDIGYDNILTITGGRGVDFVRTNTDTFQVSAVTGTTDGTLGVAAFSPSNFTLSPSNGVVATKSVAATPDFGGVYSYEVGDANGLGVAGVYGIITALNQSGGGQSIIDVISGGGIPSYSDPTGVVIGLRAAGYSNYPGASGFGLGGAAFKPQDFVIGLTGAVGLSGNLVRSVNGATGNVGLPLASTSVTGIAQFNSLFFSVSNTGTVTLNTEYSTTGNTVTSGGASQLVTISGNIARIDNRMASHTLTGVASFDPRHFAIGLSGHVSLTGPYQATGHTVIGTGAVVVTTTANTSTVDVRLADASVTGVARFSSSYFDVANGLVTLVSAYQVTGDTVTGAGANASLTVTKVNRSVTLDNRLASTSLTGVASFSSTYFSVGADVAGQVKIVMVDGGTFT